MLYYCGGLCLGVFNASCCHILVNENVTTPYTLNKLGL